MAKFTITAQLNLQAGNVGQVVRQLQQQFQGANVNFNVKQIAAAQNQLNKTSVAAQGASKSVNGLAKNIADSAKRFSALAIATGTFVGLARSIKNAVGDAITFEREMVKIAQATGQSVVSLKSLEQEISKVSTTLGVSSKELIGAARTLTQAGFAANKVRDALNLLAKTELAATFDSIADTTEGVIAILNQFGKAAQKNGTEIAFLERSLSAINQVSKEFAVESSDLITAVRTTGSAFESAGGSLDELLALFTSVRSTTRESAESIATGFRTIFTRTQRVDTINNLKKLGIELQDAEGKFVGPIEATRRLSAALSTIDPKDFRFNIIVEELGGFRQVSKVIPLIQQFSTTTKALAVAQKASGSLAEDAATAQQALAVQISKVREQFLAFIRDLTQSGPFQSTIKALLDISSAFIRVADTLKPILPMIAAFGAVKLGAAFLPALNSSFKKKNSGGIIGFASGGLVPGQGNSDTVPAMLTPGEFVIRKSSVKKLGTNNLARVNKYANGGAVQYYGTNTGAGAVKQNDISKQYSEDISRFSIIDKARVGSTKEELQRRQRQIENKSLILSDEQKYGAAFLRPIGIDKQYSGYVTKNEILKRAKIKKGSEKSKLFTQDKYPFQIQLASVNEEVRDTFQESILNGIADTVNKTSQNVFNDGMSLGGVPKNISYGILKKSNLDQTIGNIFEASLKSLSGKFTDSDAVGAGNQTFDFPKGLGYASKYFSQELSSVKTDAKASYTLKSLQSLIDKVGADIKEQYLPLADKKIKPLRTPREVINKSESSLPIPEGSILASELYSKLITKYQKAGDAAKVSVPGNVNPVSILKSGNLNPIFTSILGTRTGKNTVLKPEQAAIIKQNLKTKLGFASGGSATGSDTVPAMLTPGEFVINKKSAQAIGYTSLNRMNKIGKFANGGPVDPQRMFFGGLKNRGVPASQQASNLISNSQATVSAKGQAAIIKIFDEIALNGGNTSAALKLLNAALKQSSGTQLKATKDFKNQLKEAGKEAPKQLNTSLLLLSSVAGSVATDFTGLGDASKTALTSFITTFGVYQAITQSAADGLKDFGGTTAKIGKGLEKSGIAIAGLQAAVQAYSAYQQTKAKESSDKINKELELAASGKGNLNTITQESKKLGTASSNVSAVKSVTSLEAQILGTVGGVIGSAFGPIGTAAGLAIGTAAGAGINRYFNPPIKDAGTLFSKVNTTLFESDRALFKFNQQAEKFGEMNFNQVVATASAAALQYVNIQKELTKVNADLKNNPTDESLKLVSGQLGERLKNAGVAIDKSVSELNNKARKQIQQSASSGEFLNLDKLFEAIIAPTRERLKPSLQSKDKSIVATAEKELADATLELQRSLNADIAQILRQEAALKREEEARKAIIGSLLDEKAIKDSSAKFQFAVENLSDSVDFASSIFESGLDFKGSGFFQKIAKSFELNTPTKEFQQGLSLLGSALGDKGAALGGKLQDLQIVTANLDTAFTQLQGRGIGGGINTEKFLKDYFGSLGANADGTVVNQFIKTITSKVLGENKSSGTVPGVITPELRKEIESTFNDFSKIITEQAQAIAGAFATYEDQLSSQLAKYAKTVESFINYQADTSDGFKKFNDVLAQATGRRVTLGEKEGFRQQKAGILGISDPRTLGKQLAESQNKMIGLRAAREQTPLTNRKDIELYQRSLFDLKIKTDQTVKSLESLADQSEKTGDILSEIERIRGQREAVQGLTKRFTFGTDQERGDITKSIQALQQVFATGNIGSIPEELRGAVSGLLDEFKDVPLFNGMTGEDVSKKLQYNQLVQAGVNPQAAQSIFTASSPEKKLINQLQATFMQEQEARRILAEQQFNQQDLLINSIDALNMNFDKFLTGIFSGGRMQQMQGGAAQNALNNQSVQPVMAANADITIQQANIFDARAKMIERQQAAAQKKAGGGLIYRARGGSIFQPQGTDTVPAMLTPGEYVIKKSAVDSVGVDTLDQINSYARGGLVSYLQMGGMADRRDQLRSMPNNMLAPMAGSEDAEANREITYRNLMNTNNARTAAQMGMPGGISDQRGNEVVANARYRNIMSGNTQANQNLIPSRAGGDNGMAAANRYYSRIANIRGKSMQEAAQEYYQQQQGQIMSAPIYSDAEINMTNNSQMGGIAGFRQNQFQRQMAARQNFIGNQFAQRSNFMSNQFAARSSYNNITRLSPKQKRLLREQQMGISGVGNNGGSSTPVDSYAQSVAQNANDGRGLMPGQRVVTTAAGGTRVVRDLRGQNRKQEREKRESDWAQYGASRDADYLEKIDQAEAMRENERQSLRVAQDNARNANDAQFNINKLQAKNIKSKQNPANFRGMVVPSAGIEDSAATNTWFSYDNYRAFGRGEVDAEQGTTLEGIRSFGGGLGRGITSTIGMGASAVDLVSRQFGVSGNYGSQAMDYANRQLFGIGYRNQSAATVGGLTGSVVGLGVGGGSSGSALSGLKGLGSRGLKSARAMKTPSFSNGKALLSRFRGSKPASATIKNNAPINKVGSANSYINQNLTEKGLSYRGGVSPYSSQGTAMRQQQYLIPSAYKDGASISAGRKVGGQTVPNYIPTQWRASGGLINSVPAMLTPGEYVMSSSSVQKHGTNFMNKLNRGGKVKGFATGGAVGAMSVGASSNNNNDMSGNISALSEAFQQGASIIATAFNFEALNNIAGVFASFTESMTKISESLNGMTMTHQVTVDGQLNIAGLNIATIADAVKQEVSNLVANEVSRITGNDAKKMNPNG